jgi:hypothetical protein
VILDWGELSFPSANAVISHELNRAIEVIGEAVVDPAFVAVGHRLVMIGRTDDLDERLSQLPGISAIEVALPDHAERMCFISRLCHPKHGVALALTSDLSPDRLAALTGGLMLDDLLRARDETSPSSPLGAVWVQARKGASLSRSNGESMTVYPPGRGLKDVAGLPQVQRMIQETNYTGRAPRRVALVGPPGVGKTLVVTAIADELGLPAVALGQFRSRYVGDSERNIRKVLSTVDALSPCILHIDEFDQAVGQRNTGASADGGTSERIFAELLTYLGDNQRKERVTVIATSNRPDALDPAMFDRFTIIPVLHPTPSEAASILEIGAQREGRTLDVDVALRAIEKHDQLLTGRVLIEVLERAMTFADMSGSSSAIEEIHLSSAFGDLLMALDPAQHEMLALQAIQLCTFRSYLPWVAAEQLGQEAHLPPYLSPLLGSDGELDMRKLSERLAQLKGATCVA